MAFNALLEQSPYARGNAEYWGMTQWILAVDAHLHAACVAPTWRSSNLGKITFKVRFIATLYSPVSVQEHGGFQFFANQGSKPTYRGSELQSASRPCKIRRTGHPIVPHFHCIVGSGSPPKGLTLLVRCVLYLGLFRENCWCWYFLGKWFHSGNIFPRCITAYRLYTQFFGITLIWFHWSLSNGQPFRSSST